MPFRRAESAWRQGGGACERARRNFCNGRPHDLRGLSMVPLLASSQAVIVIGAAFVGGAFLVPPSDHEDTDLRTASVGVFDIDRHQDRAAEFRLQYRFEHEGWRLRPLLAAMATSDRALFGCAGIAYD